MTRKLGTYSIRLNGVDVPYTLTESARRSDRIAIIRNGLNQVEVRGYPGVTVAEAEIMLRRNADKLLSVLSVGGMKLPQDAHRLGMHEIDLNGVKVSYRLVEHPRREQISIFKTSEGFEVRGYPGVTVAQAEQTLREFSGWVLERLDGVPQAEKTRYSDGGRIPYRGGWATIRLNAKDVGIFSEEGGTELRMTLPKDVSEIYIRKGVTLVLRDAAIPVINASITRISPLAKKRPVSWKLSNAKRTWGNCTSKGVIRLAWRLIALSDEDIDYVVAHELAHLMVFDHSPLFWKAVGDILPSWEHAYQHIKNLKGLETLDDL